MIFPSKIISTARHVLDPLHILNVRNKQDSNLLHIASEAGNVKVVELLLRLGADPCARSFGQFPIEVALKWGYAEVVELFLKTRSLPPLTIERIFKATKIKRARQMAVRYYPELSGKLKDTESKKFGCLC